MKTKHILTIFLLIIFGTQLYAQPKKKQPAEKSKFSYADRQYDQMRYAHAIEAYELGLKYTSGTLKTYRNLANSYYKVGDMKNAERVYQLYFDDTSGVAFRDAGAIFEFAQTLAQNGQYEKAASWYEAYHLLMGHKDSRGVEHHVAYKQDIHDFYKDSVLYAVMRLDINSSQSDFGPAFYGNGIVFASSRRKENGVRRVHSWNNSAFLDLYYVDTASINERTYTTDRSAEHADHKIYSYLHGHQEMHSDQTHPTSNDSPTLGYHGHIFNRDTSDTHSGDPRPFSESINTKFHEGPATFNKEQDMMVFTRNNFYKGKKQKDKNSVNRLKLFIAKKQGNGSWGEVTEFPFNSNEYSTGHPAFSPDGKTLYFVSDMPGGQGGTDLWKSTMKEGKWTKPVNLGRKINSEGNEMFPFVDKQDVLYFSSNGWPGLGGLDIFRFEFNNLTHLNYPISSKKDDFGVVVWDNGRKGYLSSNRDFGGYDDDLYMFTAEKILKLEGTIFDRYTKKKIPNATVVLRDSTGGEVATLTTDEEGYYQVEIDYDQKYSLKGDHRRYFDTTTHFHTKDIRSQIVKQDLYLWNKMDVLLQGMVTDKETGLPLEDVHVKVTDSKTGKEIGDFTTLKDGIFNEQFKELRMKDEIAIDIHLQKDKYLAKNVSYTTQVKDTVEKLHEKLDLALDKIKIGDDIGKLLNLNPIYFDIAKWTIRPDAAKELDKIVSIMKENPGIVIELGSHTDCRSSAKSNQTLSEKRARASADYVVSQGIEKARIYGKGYGESKPINQCECEGKKVVPCTEEEHQLNRRTEFLIVKME